MQPRNQWNLYNAIVENDIELAAACIQENPYYYYRSELETPLVDAAHYNRIAIIKLLLAAGADVNQSTDRGTLLHTACIYENYTLVQLLIEAGANVDALNLYNETPLYETLVSNYHLNHNSQDIITQLVHAKADVETAVKTMNNVIEQTGKISYYTAKCALYKQKTDYVKQIYREYCTERMRTLIKHDIAVALRGSQATETLPPLPSIGTLDCKDLQIIILNELGLKKLPEKLQEEILSHIPWKINVTEEEKELQEILLNDTLANVIVTHKTAQQ